MQGQSYYFLATLLQKSVEKLDRPTSSLLFSAVDRDGGIRPFVLDEAEAAGLNAPMIDMKAPAAMKGMKFRMQVGVMDCLSCGNCADRTLSSLLHSSNSQVLARVVVKLHT